MDKKIKNHILCLKIVLLVFCIVFSFFIAAQKTEELSIYQNSIQTLDDSKLVVMKVTGASIALSVAITFLPDDWATPLADSLADMNKYFILMLGMIFVEKLLVTAGIPLVFRILIPIALVLWILHLLLGKEQLRIFASKLMVLSIVLVVVVPSGTALSKYMCNNYMTYVNDTIVVAEDGASLVDVYSETESQDKSFYDKVSNFFNTAVEGVKDLYNCYKGIIERFINSIVIMIVAYCVIPVLTFILLLWILNQLFQLETFKDKSIDIKREIDKTLSRLSIQLKDDEESEE